MSEWQVGMRCATRQRLSYSAALLTETIARHGCRAVRRGAFTLRSQDATAVASSRRGKVKGGIACSAPCATEAAAASLLADHPHGRYEGRTVKAGGGGHVRGAAALPPAQDLQPYGGDVCGGGC